MEDFATLEEVTAGLDWTLSEAEEALAEGALSTLSDDARYYGREWLDDSDCPRQVKNIVIKATRRFLRNPDGYITSRAADETVTFTDRRQESGEAHFTDREIEMLRHLGGNTGQLTSVQLTAYGRRANRPEGFVPVAGSTEKPFPFFNDNEGPW